jgi:hypothetical protein
VIEKTLAGSAQGKANCEHVVPPILLSLSLILLKPHSNNLALNSLLHWFQTFSTIINNPLHTLQQAVLHPLHLSRVMLHVRCDHTLRIIIALHHGPRETILEIAYFLLRGGCGSLIGHLALLRTLLDLFFATIFTGSGVGRRETHHQ